MRRFLRLSEWAAIVVAAIGSAVLIGWLFDIPALKSVFPTLVTMKANAAGSLVLLGAALWMLQPRHADRYAKLLRACAAVVLLIGVLTVLEYLFNRSLGIDQLLFSEAPGAIATTAPGRMALNAAFCFVLLGAAVLCFDCESRFYRRPAQLLILTTMGIAGLVPLGYLYGIGGLAGLLSYSKMAVHTALALILLGVGLLMVRPDRGIIALLTERGTGGGVARRLLSVALVLPAFSGWLETLGQEAGLYDARAGLWLVMAADTMVFGGVVWWIAGQLVLSERLRHRAEQEAVAVKDRIIESAAALASSADVIVASASQLTGTAADTATAVSQTAAAAREIARTAEYTTGEARRVSDYAQSAVAVSEAGRLTLEEAIAGSDEIRTQMRRVAERIAQLSERSRTVGDIVWTVNDLAEQASVLAINAAIEAAQAGAHGRGFEVIADEIRSLAAQSKQATVAIQGILREVQGATGGVADAAGQGTALAEAQAQRALRAGDSIRVLAEHLSESAGAATQISAAVRSQLEGMGQLTAAMETIRTASAQNLSGAREAEETARRLEELARRFRTAAGI